LSPAWETKNNNECGKRFQLPTPLYEKEGNPLIEEAGGLNSALSRDIAPLFAITRLEGARLKANICPAPATAFV
jgi:hypothetical protein